MINSLDHILINVIGLCFIILTFYWCFLFIRNTVKMIKDMTTPSSEATKEDGS